MPKPPKKLTPKQWKQENLDKGFKPVNGPRPSPYGEFYDPKKWYQDIDEKGNIIDLPYNHYTIPSGVQPTSNRKAFDFQYPEYTGFKYEDGSVKYLHNKTGEEMPSYSKGGKVKGYANGGTTGFSETNNLFNKMNGSEYGANPNDVTYRKKSKTNVNPGLTQAAGAGVLAASNQMSQPNMTLDPTGKAQTQQQTNAIDGVATAATPWYGLAKGASNIGKSFVKKDEYGDPENGTGRAINDWLTPDHELIMQGAKQDGWKGALRESSGAGKIGRTLSNLTGNNGKRDGFWGKLNKATGITENADLKNAQIYELGAEDRRIAEEQAEQNAIDLKAQRDARIADAISKRELGLKDGGKVTPANYSEGGKVNTLTRTTKTVKKAPKPIYVTDKNDPRYKAYNDSLTLHDTFKGDINLIKDFQKKFPDKEEFEFEWLKKTINGQKTPEYKKAVDAVNRLTKLNKEQPEPIEKYYATDGNSAEVYKKPVQPVVFAPNRIKADYLPPKGLGDESNTPELRPQKPEQPISMPQYNTEIITGPSYQTKLYKDKTGKVVREEYYDFNGKRINQEYASGGKVVGKGTATSDSIKAKVDEGSFIVPAINEPIANELRKKVLMKAPKKASLKSGDTEVRLSDGEHLFTPKEVKKLESKGVDLNKLAPNATTQTGRYADGGKVDYSKIIDYGLPLVQAGIGLNQIKKLGARPVDQLDSEQLGSISAARNNLNLANANARFGFSAEEQAAIDNTNKNLTAGQRFNARALSGGSSASALNNERVALIDSFNRSLQGKVANRQLQLEKQNQVFDRQAYLDHLLSRKREDKRRLFSDKLSGWNQDQEAAAGLIMAGGNNLISANRYHKELAALKNRSDKYNTSY